MPDLDELAERAAAGGVVSLVLEGEDAGKVAWTDYRERTLAMYAVYQRRYRERRERVLQPSNWAEVLRTAAQSEPARPPAPQSELPL